METDRVGNPGFSVITSAPPSKSTLSRKGQNSPTSLSRGNDAIAAVLKPSLSTEMICLATVRYPARTWLAPLIATTLYPVTSTPWRANGSTSKNCSAREATNIHTVDYEATHHSQIEANDFEHRAGAIHETPIRDAFHIGIGLDRRALEAALLAT